MRTLNCIIGTATTRTTDRLTWCCSIPTASVRFIMHRKENVNRRVPPGTLVMLERSAGKLARCVLRGLRLASASSLAV
jgi:hypothetical protein